MARDHARIRLDIWNDDDFLALTSGAQRLYLYLLSASSLSFAGVADWRPGRIAAKCSDWSASDVEVFAAELIEGEFILVDAPTEEVMVRSFVKHDGLMKSPNMAAAFCKALSAVASPVLRAVVVDQLKRLHEAVPDLKGWGRPDVKKALARRAMSFPQGVETLRETLPQTLRVTLPETLPNDESKGSDDPSANPSVTPNSLLLTPNSQLRRGATEVTTRGKSAPNGLARVLAIAGQEDDQ